MRPVPSKREIIVVFPDRYRRIDVGTSASGEEAGLDSLIGFDGLAILSSPRVPDDEATMRSARQDFAREMLMRLPREAAEGPTLSQRVRRDGGQDRLAIDASDRDGFSATLLADANTCVPIALEYRSASRSSTGMATVRVDLSDYRPFGGIRFATVLKTSYDGQPFAEEYVSNVELNAPGAADSFAPMR